MVTSLVPWEARPLPMFDTLRREMDRLMDNFFGEGDGGRLESFSPRMNLAETEDHYEVTVDLPGMKPEEFDIQLQDNELWITGERKQEAEQQGRTFHRVERYYGRFRRVIPLGAGVDSEHVQAEYKDGVLRITVAKEASAQRKRIEVKT
ncbi:MAG: Hsp20/alpha crystallin family protein [Thermoguttaceae bacterium]|nr:Hsp20/alpha crystallin family protein [Thermoguttaceae bacterium]